MFKNKLFKVQKMDLILKLPSLFYKNLKLLYYANAAIDNMVRKEELIS